MIFAPRVVPPSSWRSWLVCGVALSTRRVGAFVLYGAGCVLLHAVPASVGFGTLAVPFALGLGCLLAECGDRGLAILPALGAKPWQVHARLLLAGTVVALGFWLVGVLVTALALSAGVEPAAIGTPLGDGASGGFVGALAAAWFLSAAAVLFGTSVVVGFLVPLLALGELPLKEALVLALVATGRNVFAMFFVAGLALTALIGLLTPFLVVPWTAIVSATLYAGYRDVFLGRVDNAPATVASRGAVRRILPMRSSVALRGDGTR